MTPPAAIVWGFNFARSFVLVKPGKGGGVRYTNFIMRNDFTAVCVKRGRWYVGFVKEITGVNTQGKTLSEVKKNLREALVMILQFNYGIAHPNLLIRGHNTHFLIRSK